MKIFIATRKDMIDWDQCDEQTILAKDEEEALLLASMQFGDWQVKQIKTKEGMVLTKSFQWG